MDDEDPRQQTPPFQMTPQVAVIIMVTMLAMGVPLFGVAWLASDYLRAPRAPEVVTGEPVAENPALRSALEQAAASSLSVEPLATDRAVLEIRAPEAIRAERVRTLKEVVGQQGGSVVELETETRFLVSTPTGGQVALRRALEGQGVSSEPTTPDSSVASNAGPGNAGATDAAGEFFEIRFVP